jgi:hypothetical protein
MYEMYLKIKLRPAAFLLGRDELLKEFLVKRYINLAVEEVNRFGPFFFFFNFLCLQNKILISLHDSNNSKLIYRI